MSDSSAFIAASADIGRDGQPVVFELMKDSGRYLIREHVLLRPEEGPYGLGDSYSAGDIAFAWALLTGDEATAIRIAGGTA